ncbi:MAG: hypothetical protein ISR69_10510 [Gammaproteobacteria bacterium]|nr:hypothetical protein [Gammaproteobacteria bacterium]
MNFKKMTKQQLKEYGETIGVNLDLKRKKAELIDEINKASIQEGPVTSATSIKSSAEFDIKQYIWIALFMVLLVINAEGANYSYAAGVVTNMIVKDGLLLTLIAWAIMTKGMKRESWEWYDWLNALAYTTIVARIIYIAITG